MLGEPEYNMNELFAQLGLDSSDEAIDKFIAENQLSIVLIANRYCHFEGCDKLLFISSYFLQKNLINTKKPSYLRGLFHSLIKLRQLYNCLAYGSKCATASRSSLSSCSVAAIFSLEKSDDTSTPSTIVQSPFVHVHGNE